MIGRLALLLAASAVLLPACSSKSRARIATETETLAILAPLFPKGPPGLFCVSPELGAPLEDQQGYAAHAADQVSQLSWWDWLNRKLSGEPQSWKPQWNAPDDNPFAEGRPIPKQDATRLEGLLDRAVEGRIPLNSVQLKLPANVAACSKADIERERGDGSGPITVFFSRPVVIDDTAFVEVGSVCGLLCGNGHLAALAKRNNKWMPIAEKATWIS